MNDETLQLIQEFILQIKLICDDWPEMKHICEKIEKAINAETTKRKE